MQDVLFANMFAEMLLYFTVDLDDDAGQRSGDERETSDEFSDAEPLYPNQLQDPAVYARYIAQFNGEIGNIYISHCNRHYF